jgi:hypothetical protein
VHATQFRSTRRLWLLALFTGASVWSADPVLDFVQVTDAHLICEGIHPGIAATLDLKKDSAAHLTAVIHTLSADPAPAFVLLTGDLIDAYTYDGPSGHPVSGPMDAFHAIVENSPIPIFLSLGNHDITSYHYQAGKATPSNDQNQAADARQAWMRTIPSFRGGTYYAFRKTVGHTGYLFLVLDDGDGPGRSQDFVSAQVAWLKGQIAAHGRDSIILAMHIPLERANLWTAAKPLLAGAPNVVLAIAGHRHSDGLEDVDLGTRKLPQVRTAALFTSADNWRRFRLHEDRIEVSATGKAAEIVKTIAIERAMAAGAR